MNAIILMPKNITIRCREISLDETIALYPLLPDFKAQEYIPMNIRVRIATKA